MDAVVGALRAVLSLESAAFQRGLTNAEKSLADFDKRMKNIGAAMQKRGAVMTAALTVPIAGLAKATSSATNAFVEIDKGARLAGLSVDEFKLLALATDQFGISEEKLSDILKDVNDKMGDFSATGKGPLADFFDNVAPKVGITADAFRDLNSADALQLYISSLEKANVTQAESTFYLEALANDATLLAPAFADGGAAIAKTAEEARALGFALDDNLIGSAQETQRKFRLASEVIGIQMQQALVSLAPAFSELAATVTPVLQKIVDGVTSLAESFLSLSPEAQATIGSIIAFAAIAGPLVVAAGLIVSSLGTVAIALKAIAVLAIANPIGLAVAALVAGAALIYANWDGIAAFFTETWEAVTQGARDAWDAVEAAWANVRDSFVVWLAGVQIAFIQSWESIKATAAQWASDFLQIGRDIVEGLRRGIEEKWTALTTYFRDKAQALTDSVKGVFGIESPSRVFREIGRFITEGLGLGIRDGVPEVSAAMGGVEDAVIGGGDSLTSGMHTLGEAAKSAFSSFVTGAMDAKDAVAQLLDTLASNLASAASDNLFASIGKVLGFANGGALNGGRVQAFAAGGIVNGPTVFPMANGAGLMGEAGPEAIMPLTRIGGKLGVRAAGGGNTTVQIDARYATEGTAAMIAKAIQQAAPGIVRQSVSATRAAGARGY
jgi:hypothetical protein